MYSVRSIALLEYLLHLLVFLACQKMKNMLFLCFSRRCKTFPTSILVGFSSRVCDIGYHELAKLLTI